MKKLSIVFSSILAACGVKPSTNEPTVQLVDPNEIAFSEHRHQSFSDAFLARIKFTTDTFEPIDGISFEQAVDLYKSDLNPENNIIIWEEMARVFLSFCEDNCETIDKKKEVYNALLLASMFPKEEVILRLEPQILTTSEVESLTSSYSLEPEPIPVVRE